MDSLRGRFAVVLNMNAKKVTREVQDLSGELVPPEDLFFSASAEDSQRITNVIVEKGYDTVFAGGGDGTVMQLLQQISYVPQDRRPAVGILKLGTGNAMARMVSSGNIEGDLKSYIRSATREYVWLSLVECDNVRFPFAGLGWDAEILNDYRYVKSTLGKTALKPVLQTVGGYFVSFFTRTLPRHAGRAVSGKSIEGTFSVLDGRALEVGAEGRTLREFGPGEKFYEGRCNIAMVGTVPYYGYGLKVLPYANKYGDFFQVRVVTLSTAKALAVLPKVWKGEYAGEGIQDFLVQDINSVFSQPIPYQVGGDAEGDRSSARFTLVPNAVRLLKLL